jgi:hypothetical protein
VTTKEKPSDPGMAELQDVLNAAGCIVNVHHAYGEWMQVLLPSGKIVAIEKAQGPLDTAGGSPAH